jgi:hypothetical protein
MRAGTASTVHTDTIILTLTVVTGIEIAIVATTGVTITAPGTSVQRKCRDG